VLLWERCHSGIHEKRHVSSPIWFGRVIIEEETRTYRVRAMVMIP